MKSNSSLFANTVLLLAALGFVSLGAQPASAQLINLNFTSVPYAGTTETSPSTPGGPAGTWNNLTNGVLSAADSYESEAATVLLSDGSPGPTLTFDSSSGTGTGTNWNGTSLSVTNMVDYTTSGGVYDVASLYESGMVNGGNSTTGFRVKGLTPGNYEVYLVPMFRGAQVAGVKADAAVTFSIGLGNDTDARNTGDYTLTSTAANPIQNVDTRLTNWVASVDGSTNAYNYIGASVTIDSTNRWLVFLLRDSATTTDRPGPSVIQLRRAGEVAAAPRITQIVKSGASVIISGTNGAPNGPYHALRSSTVQAPFASWTSVLTNNFDSSGNFIFTNAPAGSPAFYIIQQQP